MEDQIKYYRHKNNQDLIVFLHNVTKGVYNKIHEFKDCINCIYVLSANIKFADNKVHECIYMILKGSVLSNQIKKNIRLSNKNYVNFNYSNKYDWISFPEADEFLEGPNRSKTYYQHLCDINNNKNINKITFDNIIFWFTKKDNPKILSPIARIKYYCYFKNCPIRLYAWRGNKTIIRFFGHPVNESLDDSVRWKTRHYEMRSYKHFIYKISSRKILSKEKNNHHYTAYANNLKKIKNYGIINPKNLHYDDGISELSMVEKYNWRNWRVGR